MEFLIPKIFLADPYHILRFIHFPLQRPNMELCSDQVEDKLISRVYQKNHFFEIFSAVFYFMQKCPKNARKKISGHLEVIWPLPPNTPPEIRHPIENEKKCFSKRIIWYTMSSLRFRPLNGVNCTTIRVIWCTRVQKMWENVRLLSLELFIWYVDTWLCGVM